MQQKSACFAVVGRLSREIERGCEADQPGGFAERPGSAGGDEKGQRISILTRAALDGTCALRKLRTPMAAGTAMMAATVSSSMRVKPGRFPALEYLPALSALRLSPSCACFHAPVFRGLSAAARPPIVPFPHSPKSMGHPSPPPCISRRSPLLFVPFVAS